MAEKVGRLHQHELPSAYNTPLHDVYACYCGKEFYRGTSETHNKPMWGPVDDSGLPIKYDKTVGGKEFIGRADKDTAFDEEPVDQLAEEVTDGAESSDAEANRDSGGDSTESSPAEGAGST